MRELIADLFVTVDGFAEGRDAPAFFGYAGPELLGWIDEQLTRPHTLVMGANTYRLLADIVASGGDPNGARMTALPKLVFSSSLRPPLPWGNTTLIADDVAVAVPALKAESAGPLRVIGSLSLVRSMLRAGVVDRLRLMVFPQVLGDTGRQPVFSGLPDLDLVLVSTAVLDRRLVLLEYAPGPRARR